MTHLSKKILLVLILLSLFSCGGNTQITPTTSDNFIVYKSKKYFFDKAKINYIGLAPNPKSSAYKISLILISKDIVLATLPRGKGNMFVLTFYTNQQKNIPSGNYNTKYFLSTEEAKYQYIDAKYSSFMLEYNSETMSRTEAADISSGSVAVANNNGEYVLTFNLKDASGEAVTGSYKGMPELF